mmetsp:Transcript_36895/g.67313  ORF Transcript_36895/g.67313 Transcript_36895/m.67313 type:complete len:135 (-) Transcript_36895:80-484(-)
MGAAPTCRTKCCDVDETLEETVVTREAKWNMDEVSKEAAKTAPSNSVSGLPVEFVLPGGAVQTIVFKYRPLGMTFANKVPLQVVKIVPGGGADKLGVKVGWEFGKIAGKTLEGLDWKALIDFFQSEANKLPLAV